MKESIRLRSAVKTVLKSLGDRLDNSRDFDIFKPVPNKRKAGKVFIGGYVTAKIKRQFQKLAKDEADGDCVRMLQILVHEALEKRHKKRAKGPKNPD